MFGTKGTLFLAVVAVPVIAAADTPDPGVNHRQHNQQDRIAQGVRSGSLTRGEANGLRDEQRKVRQEERQYEADGALTRGERKDLQQDLNASIRSIYNEKHDAETR